MGEDQGVSALLKEKDVEIANLRAQLDDKDRMLTALRSAARSRDTAERDPRASLSIGASHLLDNAPLSPVSARASQLEPLSSPILTKSPMALLSPKSHKPAKSVDEMSKILDEMIQDRVESGHLVKGARGSVRLASERKREVVIDPIAGIDSLRGSMPLSNEHAVEATES